MRLDTQNNMVFSFSNKIRLNGKSWGWGGGGLREVREANGTISKVHTFLDENFGGGFRFRLINVREKWCPQIVHMLLFFFHCLKIWRPCQLVLWFFVVLAFAWNKGMEAYLGLGLDFFGRSLSFTTCTWFILSKVNSSAGSAFRKMFQKYNLWTEVGIN